VAAVGSFAEFAYHSPLRSLLPRSTKLDGGPLSRG
jgi:hypothetical protein